MKIYTKTGDKGTTSLVGGERRSKDCTRIEAYGTVDELNSSLGVVLASGPHTEIATRLRTLQHRLFDLGSELATPPSVKSDRRLIGTEDIRLIEGLIDDIAPKLEPLSEFILPGGSVAAAHLHLARTVCRRAERAVVRLASEEEMKEEIITYLNRISDLLFVLARYANHLDRIPETKWER